MTLVHVQQNTPGFPDGADRSNQQQGVIFQVTQACDVTRVGYQPDSAQSNRVPDSIALWNAGTGTVVRRWINIPQPVGTGWQWKDVGDPLTLSVGVEYRLTNEWGASRWGTSRNNGSIPAAPSPFTLTNGYGCYGTNTANLPGTAAWAGNVSLEVEVFPAGLNPGPDGSAPTNENISGRLAEWLSSDAAINTHETDGLPWLTHALATAINTAVGSTKSMVEGLVAIGIGAKLGDAQAALDGLEAFLYSIAPANLKQYLDGLESNIRGGGSPTIADAITAINGIPTPTGASPRTVGLAGWTQVAQTVGQGSFQWDQAADAFVFHTEDMVESARFEQGVGSGSIHWFRGWAKPWDGANYYPPRVEVVGLDTIIHDGQRWPGLALWVPSDVEWTLTAYDYSGS